jgi:hypothetical protein
MDNTLFDTNKSLEYMKLKYYKLNKKYSFEYYNNIDFKNKIDSKILLKNKQLSLNLSFCNITDISMLGELHTLNLCVCENIIDISMLGNLKTHCI